MPRAREKNSSWSAGTQPRARPFRNTGIAQLLGQRAQRVLAVGPVEAGAGHDHRALGAAQQLGGPLDVPSAAGSASGSGSVDRRVGVHVGLHEHVVEREVDERGPGRRPERRGEAPRRPAPGISAVELRRAAPSA